MDDGCFGQVAILSGGVFCGLLWKNIICFFKNKFLSCQLAFNRPKRETIAGTCYRLHKPGNGLGRVWIDSNLFRPKILPFEFFLEKNSGENKLDLI